MKKIAEPKYKFDYEPYVFEWHEIDVISWNNIENRILADFPDEYASFTAYMNGQTMSYDGELGLLVYLVDFKRFITFLNRGGKERLINWD